MRRLTLLGLVGAVVVAFAASSLSAQSRPTKVVFVDSQAALMAHSSGAAVNALREQASAEINDLAASINALERRIVAGDQLSAEDAERYQTLQTSLSAIQNRYLAEIDAAAAPAVAAVNAIIIQLSQENGYTIVLDREAARESRLVVYSDGDLDITDLVLARLAGQ